MLFIKLNLLNKNNKLYPSTSMRTNITFVIIRRCCHRPKKFLRTIYLKAIAFLTIFVVVFLFTCLGVGTPKRLA